MPSAFKGGKEAFPCPIRFPAVRSSSAPVLLPLLWARLLCWAAARPASNSSIEVKVGDKISNWNNLAVQLTSVFHPDFRPPMSRAMSMWLCWSPPSNRSSQRHRSIGAPNILEINEAYPLDTDAAKSLPTRRLLPRSVRFHHRFRRGLRRSRLRSGERRLSSLYDSTTETFTDAPSQPAPAGCRLH